MSTYTSAVFGVAAMVLLFGAFYVGKPITEYTTPGEWKTVQSTDFTKAYDTLLLPNQTAEAYHYYYYHVYPELCLAWSAQNGYQSITTGIFSESVKKLGIRKYDVGPKREITEEEANYNCFRNQKLTIQLQNTDTKPNVVRVVFATPHKGANPAGFQNNLCNDPSRYVTDCKNLPLTPASEFPSHEAMAAVNEERKYQGALVAASSILVIALGHPLITFSILFDLLKRLVPSPRAWAARRELRRSAQTDQTYDASQHSSYRKRSSTPFHQHQDIDDLDELAREAKAEAERVREEIRREKEKQAARKTAEEADQKRLDELAKEMKEVAARMRRREQGE